MAGYVRQDTANNIANGNVVDADDLDSEFNAVEAAFNSSTGHTHDGTSAEGAPILVTGPAQEYVSGATALYPKTDDAYDLGTVSLQYKDVYIDGIAYLDEVDIDAGAIDGTVIGGVSPAAGSFTTVTITGDLTTSGLIDGRDVAADGTKLDTVEENADVTDTANVTSAGALMDSELTSEASVKAINQGLATFSSPSFNNLTLSSGTPALTFTESDGATDYNQEYILLSSNTLQFQTRNSSGTFVSADYYMTRNAFGATNHVWSIGNTEAIRINENGNLGLGTVSPSEKLSVVGNITTSGTIVAGGDISAAGFTFNGTVITATAAELNYSDGVTSNIQTQLNNKQPLDATLTGLSGLATGVNKIPRSVGTDTFSQLDFLDEDDFSSDSASGVPSQQSVKAYADSFGWTFVEDLSSAGTPNFLETSDFTSGYEYAIRFNDLVWTVPSTASREIRLYIYKASGAAYHSDYFSITPARTGAAAYGWVYLVRPTSSSTNFSVENNSVTKGSVAFGATEAFIEGPSRGSNIGLFHLASADTILRISLGRMDTTDFEFTGGSITVFRRRTS